MTFFQCQQNNRVRLDFCCPCFESPHTFLLCMNSDFCPQKYYIYKPHILLNPERSPVKNKHAAHHQVLTFLVKTYTAAICWKSYAILVFFFLTISCYLPFVTSVRCRRLKLSGILPPLHFLNVHTHSGGPDCCGLGVLHSLSTNIEMTITLISNEPSFKVSGHNMRHGRFGL